MSPLKRGLGLVAIVALPIVAIVLARADKGTDVDSGASDGSPGGASSSPSPSADADAAFKRGEEEGKKWAASDRVNDIFNRTYAEEYAGEKGAGQRRIDALVAEKFPNEGLRFKSGFVNAYAMARAHWTASELKEGLKAGRKAGAFVDSPHNRSLMRRNPDFFIQELDPELVRLRYRPDKVSNPFQDGWVDGLRVALGVSDE